MEEVRKKKGVGFGDVEVIELAMVPGERHPSQRIYVNDDDSDNDSRDTPPRYRQDYDAADMTLSWEPQSRTRVDVDAYEETKRRRLRMGKTLMRMSRSVRKRILRNFGADNADPDSEDEYRSRKKKKKKKKRKKDKQKRWSEEYEDSPGRRGFMSSPVASSPLSPTSQGTDRFALGNMEKPSSTRSDLAPQMPSRSDNAPGLPKRWDSEVSAGVESYEVSHSSPVPNEGGWLSTPKSKKKKFTLGKSPISAKRVTSALGIMAKQPVRFAKYTSKKVRKGFSSDKSQTSPFVATPPRQKSSMAGRAHGTEKESRKSSSMSDDLSEPTPTASMPLALPPVPFDMSTRTDNSQENFGGASDGSISLSSPSFPKQPLKSAMKSKGMKKKGVTLESPSPALPFTPFDERSVDVSIDSLGENPKTDFNVSFSVNDMAPTRSTKSSKKNFGSSLSNMFAKLHVRRSSRHSMEDTDETSQPSRRVSAASREGFDISTRSNRSADTISEVSNRPLRSAMKAGATKGKATKAESPSSKRSERSLPYPPFAEQSVDISIESLSENLNDEFELSFSLNDMTPRQNTKSSKKKFGSSLSNMFAKIRVRPKNSSSKHSREGGDMPSQPSRKISAASRDGFDFSMRSNRSADTISEASNRPLRSAMKPSALKKKKGRYNEPSASKRSERSLPYPPFDERSVDVSIDSVSIDLNDEFNVSFSVNDMVPSRSTKSTTKKFGSSLSNMLAKTIGRRALGASRDGLDMSARTNGSADTISGGSKDGSLQVSPLPAKRNMKGRRFQYETDSIDEMQSLEGSLNTESEDLDLLSTGTPGQKLPPTPPRSSKDQQKAGLDFQNHLSSNPVAGDVEHQQHIQPRGQYQIKEIVSSARNREISEKEHVKIDDAVKDEEESGGIQHDEAQGQYKSDYPDVQISRNTGNNSGLGDDNVQGMSQQHPEQSIPIGRIEEIDTSRNDTQKTSVSKLSDELGGSSGRLSGSFGSSPRIPDQSSAQPLQIDPITQMLSPNPVQVNPITQMLSPRRVSMAGEIQFADQVLSAPELDESQSETNDTNESIAAQSSNDDIVQINPVTQMLSPRRLSMAGEIQFADQVLNAPVLDESQSETNDTKESTAGQSSNDDIVSIDTFHSSMEGTYASKPMERPTSSERILNMDDSSMISSEEAIMSSVKSSRTNSESNGLRSSEKDPASISDDPLQDSSEKSQTSVEKFSTRTNPIEDGRGGGSQVDNHAKQCLPTSHVMDTPTLSTVLEPRMEIPDFFIGLNDVVDGEVMDLSRKLRTLPRTSRITEMNTDRSESSTSSSLEVAELQAAAAS